jgi:type II secretory pathway pseudopilin PulG
MTGLRRASSPGRGRPAITSADRRDVGETLVEIVMTVVIVGIAVTALISGLATTTSASTTNRATADGDTVMRNFAEAIKDAAGTCVDGLPIVAGYTPPAGFGATISPANPVCPAVTETQRLTLDVTGPSGVHQAMQIVVRTP